MLNASLEFLRGRLGASVYVAMTDLPDKTIPLEEPVDPEAAAAALKLFDFDCIISADIGRTFPNHLLFKDKDGGGQASLRRVLRAHLGGYEPVLCTAV